MPKRKWRTRTSGSSRQLGKHFMIEETATKRMNLPRIKGVKSQAQDVVFNIKNVPIEDIQWSENPVNLEERIQRFMTMYENGVTIPPITVTKTPDGKYRVLDGHVRLETFKRLGFTRIPANINASLELTTKGRERLYRQLERAAKKVSVLRKTKPAHRIWGYEKLPTSLIAVETEKPKSKGLTQIRAQSGYRIPRPKPTESAFIIERSTRTKRIRKIQ